MVFARPRLWLLIALFYAYVFSAYACTLDRDKETGEKLTPQELKALDEYKAEVEIGRNMAGRLLAHYGTNGNQRLIGYINQVGNYVASYGDHPERRYMFAILDSEIVNAFACPGGYILITQGAIRAATSEAELAGVLGHEVAHVGKSHMMNTLKKMDKKELEKNSKEAEQLKGGFAVKMRKRPKPQGTGAGAMLARYLSGSAGAGLNILQAASAGMNVILKKGLDKQLEEEADREGVKYAIRAGYEPRAMLQYLKRLGKGQKAQAIKNLGRTHPPIKARRKNITKLLKTLQADEIIGATGDKRFKKMHSLLPSQESS